MDLPEETLTDANAAIQPADEPSAEQTPTRNVATFWNRLDELFDDMKSELNSKGQEAYSKPYRSFLFQPDRVSLNSHDAQQITTTVPIANGTDAWARANPTLAQETFSPFTIVFEKPLVKVKSIQLLSAIIPNPQPSIPDNECTFYYYRMRTLFNAAYTNSTETGNPVWNSSAIYERGDVVVYQSAIPHTIPVLYFTYNYQPYLYAYTATDPGALSAIGTSFTISGAANSAWNGTFASQGTQGTDVGSWAVIAFASQGLGNSSTATITYYTYTNYTYYVSQVNSNTNNTPDSSPNQWVQVGQSGGQTTAIYEPWGPAVSYSTGDVVFYSDPGGATYFYQSVSNANQSNLPPGNNGTNTDWTGIGKSCATSPNWYDITSANIQYVRLLPSSIPTEIYPNTTGNFAYGSQNTTFADYPSLIKAMNNAAECPRGIYACSIPYDAKFLYSEIENKIVFVPQNQQQWDPVTNVYNDGYTYLYIGWDDPNYKSYATFLKQKYGYTLNLRTGFTWNGHFSLPTDPWNGTTGNPAFFSQIINYVTPFQGINQSGQVTISAERESVTANTYANLVYTQSIRIYCDVTQGSTQDSAGNAGLLSVVPMSATTLGVSFYQNNFNRPLTKIIEFIPSITISMKTDSGDDYVLPSNASVSLELALEYE